jgi:putative transcription factor
MSHQDWATITIGNPVKKNVQKEIVAKKGDTSVSDGLKKIENDTENFSHQKIPSLLSREITSARNNLKLTQKEMAIKLNIQQNIYVELENGKAIYSSATKQLINKMERVINVKFNNKK